MSPTVTGGGGSETNNCSVAIHNHLYLFQESVLIPSAYFIYGSNMEKTSTFT